MAKDLRLLAACVCCLFVIALVLVGIVFVAAKKVTAINVPVRQWGQVEEKKVYTPNPKPYPQKSVDVKRIDDLKNVTVIE